MADGMDKTPREIEREIEAERAELSDSLTRLQEQFSPENILNTISDTLKTSGQDVGSAIARGVRENPAALALTGIGIAWLILGTSRRDDEPRTPVRTTSLERAGAMSPAVEPATGTAPGYVPPASDPAYAPGTVPPAGEPAYVPGNAPTSGGFATDRDPSAFTSRVAAADAARRAQMAGQAERWDLETSQDGSIVGQAKDAYGRARRYVRRTVAELQDRLYDGTEDLSDVARSRVVQARQRAIAAQAKVEAAARRARDESSRAYYEQPLVAGALAAVVGAAVASLLPRTEMEDRAFGAQSDHVFNEAERIFHEERQRARRMAAAAIREGGDIVRENLRGASEEVPEGEDVVEQAEAAAQSAGNRIASAAMEAREDEDTAESPRHTQTS